MARPDVDLSEVRGQASAKLALGVAAAGGHNLLMLFTIDQFNNPNRSNTLPMTI